MLLRPHAPSAALVALRGYSANAAAVRDIIRGVLPTWGVVLAALVILVLLVAWWRWFSSKDDDEDATGLQKDEAGRVKDQRMRRETPRKGQNYGLLQANFDAEQLSHDSTHMFEFTRSGMSNKTFKMLHYDTDRATGWASMFNLGHTCLADMHLWKTCSVYVALSLVLATVSFTMHMAQRNWDVEETATRLSNASVYLSALLGFMLGLFVSEIISRWWRCRMDCIEALWDALSDTQMLLSMRCTAPEDAAFKETILRLGLVTHRLLYAEARGQEDTAHLRGLADAGLLREDELQALDNQPAKGQLVLVWIGVLYTTLGEKRGWSKEFIKSLNEQMCKARGAVGKTFAYCQTQLPFQYVHLLSFCVLLCNLLLATKCGIVMGYSVTDGYIVRAAMQVFQVVVQPFAYHAFLRLCCELSNPFGHDFSDFPGFAYHCYIRAEGFAIHKAGEKTPEGLRKLVA